MSTIKRFFCVECNIFSEIGDEVYFGFVFARSLNMNLIDRIFHCLQGLKVFGKIVNVVFNVS